MVEFTGRCCCGSVSYIVQGAPKVVAQCHCEECRRISGTGHSVGAMFYKGDLEVSGELSTYKYVSNLGSEVTKAFCPNCGSPIFGSNSRIPEFVTLPLGSMDEAEELKVEVVIFDSHQQHWDALGQDVMHFDTQPNWQPSD